MKAGFPPSPRNVRESIAFPEVLRILNKKATDPRAPNLFIERVLTQSNLTVIQGCAACAFCLYFLNSLRVCGSALSAQLILGNVGNIAKICKSMALDILLGEFDLLATTFPSISILG